jgi:dinuclear metal center YbgI/SA1388 family protein
VTATVRRDELVAHLDELLDARGYRDYGPIGLHVIGADEVTHVAVATSASLDVFERAGKAGAQMLIVHHGLWWDGQSQVVGLLERRRLESLFRHDITLVAYHLPLDGHDTLGNNAVLAQLLGVVDPKPFAEHRGRPLGRYGTLATPEGVAEIAARIGVALGSSPVVFPGGPDEVRTIGVVSGDAAGDVRNAATLGLDCFLTGEPSEDTAYLAAELGVTVIAAGHNATETVGVRAVAAHLEERYGLRTTFLPVTNPV